MTTTRSHGKDAVLERSSNVSASPGDAPRFKIECLCPYCGEFNSRVGGPCEHCFVQDGPQARERLSNRSGVWSVLGLNTDSNTGFDFQGICGLIRRRFLHSHTVVRGPATDQLWRLASKVRGISRELGLCYACGEDIEPTCESCSYCRRTQLPFPEPRQSSASDSASNQPAIIATVAECVDLPIHLVPMDPNQNTPSTNPAGPSDAVISAAIDTATSMVNALTARLAQENVAEENGTITNYLAPQPAVQTIGEATESVQTASDSPTASSPETQVAASKSSKSTQTIHEPKSASADAQPATIATAPTPTKASTVKSNDVRRPGRAQTEPTLAHRLERHVPREDLLTTESVAQAFHLTFGDDEIQTVRPATRRSPFFVSQRRKTLAIQCGAACVALLLAWPVGRAVVGWVMKTPADVTSIPTVAPSRTSAERFAPESTTFEPRRAGLPVHVDAESRAAVAASSAESPITMPEIIATATPTRLKPADRVLPNPNPVNTNFTPVQISTGPSLSGANESAAVPVDDDPAALWQSGLNAEAKGDLETAIDRYERLESLSSEQWPQGLQLRLKLVKQQLRGDGK